MNYENKAGWNEMEDTVMWGKGNSAGLGGVYKQRWGREEMRKILSY